MRFLCRNRQILMQWTTTRHATVVVSRFDLNPVLEHLALLLNHPQQQRSRAIFPSLE